MNNKSELQKLVEHFEANIEFYKDTKKAYNEHSCRIEFIDPFLKILGWDVANEKGAAVSASARNTSRSPDPRRMNNQIDSHTGSSE